MLIPVRDVTYAVDRTGAGSPVVLLHGFTGSSASWAEVSRELAHEHDVIAIDALGHGDSSAPEDPRRYHAAEQVADLHAVLDRLGVTRAVVVGYSMGARLALAFAAAYPSRVSALVLVSGGVGERDAADRASRVLSDEALASAIQRDGIEPFVERWERLPLWTTQMKADPSVLRRQREIRLRQRPAGLAGSLRGFGQGQEPSYWDDLAHLPMPVRLVVGAEDAKYVQRANDMASMIPDVQVVVLPGIGHGIPVEDPQALVREVRAMVGDQLVEQARSM